jgi:hypothetical protein
MSLGRFLEAHVEKELGGSMAIEGPNGLSQIFANFAVLVSLELWN